MWIWNQCDQRVYMLRQCWDKQKTKFAYIYIYIKEFKSRKKDQKRKDIIKKLACQAPKRI